MSKDLKINNLFYEYFKNIENMIKSDNKLLRYYAT